MVIQVVVSELTIVDMGCQIFNVLDVRLLACS